MGTIQRSMYPDPRENAAALRRHGFLDIPDSNYLKELVIRARQGDSAALAELFSATYQRQYAYAYRVLRDEHLAHDALQESYVRVMKNIGKLRDPRLFTAWLNQINRHVCYDMIKQRSRNCGEVDIDSMQDLASPEPTPEDEIAEIDYNRYILSRVERLPDTESRIITMRYYLEISLTDIADQLGISVSTVKRHLRSARTHLENIITWEENGMR